MAKKKDYNLDSIKTHSTIEGIRTRPSMYIGMMDEDGIFQLFLEAFTNSIDEYMSGNCTKIEIIIQTEDESITVIDNGRGMPFDLTKAGIEKFITIFTKAHTGGKFDNEAYAKSGGTNGIGIKATNALSSSFIVKSTRKEGELTVEFKEGEVVNTTKKERVGKGTGTEITFIPDRKIFGDCSISYDKVMSTVEEISFLCPKLEITLNIDDEEQKFKSRQGLSDYVVSLNKETKTLSKVGRITAEQEGMELDIAFQFAEESHYKLFANMVPNLDGTHMTGLKTGITTVLKRLIKGGVSNEFLMRHFSFVLSLKIATPIFVPQTKEKLTNPEVRAFVSQSVANQLDQWLEENPTVKATIIKLVSNNQKAEEAANKVREKYLEISKETNTGKTFLYSDKYTPSIVKDGLTNELFIVEGDSAGGSAIKARNPKTQGIISLFGKIPNAYKTTPDKFFENKSVQTFMKAIGATLAPGFKVNLTKCNYGKIVCLTDSDVDGAHISLLILAFFFKYIPQLLVEHRIYVVVPALFKVEYKGGYKFIENDAALSEFKKQNKGSLKVNRYKGLGELDYPDLKNYAMDPITRKWKCITMKDKLEASKTMVSLMGIDTTDRKEILAYEK